MLVYYWLLVVFIVGAMVGSFLNVVISRVPFEKSIIWPGSRCGSCYQPIRWYDNLPIVSYLWLRGRCRSCGQAFSPRYLMIELATALGFAGLYYLELVLNVHGWPAAFPQMVADGIYPFSWWLGYGYHTVLFAFLLAISVCDLDRREIPLSITVAGTLVGLVGSMLFPWPWPHDPPGIAAMPFVNMPIDWRGVPIKEGIYAWPVWGPLPALCAPGGNWQTGLATGVAGALAGTFLMRGVGFIVGKGLGKEAMGLGDADLMMMAGAFLGWQIVVIGLFVSVAPAMLFALFNAIVHRDTSLPFGPSLSAGVLITSLAWHWIGHYVQPLLFFGELMIGFLAVGAIVMLLASFLLRAIKMLSW